MTWAKVCFKFGFKMDEDRPQKPPSKPRVSKRKIPKRVSESWLRNSSLYYLERHPASVAHYIQVMDRKMQRSLRAHPDQNLEPFGVYLREKLVPEFLRAGYLNDSLFAGALKDSLARKGLPKAEIKRRLKVKGITNETIDDLPMDDHDDLSAALT
ncbi:MAG TPA: hypothetical protein VIN59_02675, partial [Alphaproteobacteria bacterium]